MRRLWAWVGGATLLLGGAAAPACGGDSEDGGASGGSAGAAGTAAGGSTTAAGGSGQTGGGENQGGGGNSVDATSCEAASDCGWGEIDHEILDSADCICLLGCPYLPLNQATIDRRLGQYQTHCDPQVDGNGNPCPIDECMLPPDPTCADNVCGPLDPFG